MAKAKNRSQSAASRKTTIAKRAATSKKPSPKNGAALALRKKTGVKGRAVHPRSAKKKNQTLSALHKKFIAAGAVLVLLVLAVLGVKNLLNTSAATTSAVSFVGIGGKCLDNNHSILARGNKIQLWNCNSTNAQKWQLGSGGSIKNVSGDYCLDVTHSSTAQYTYVQLWTCNGTAAQQWKVSNNQLINTHTGFCLTDQYASTADGTRQWMKVCHGSEAQKWVPTGEVTTIPTPPPTTGGGGGSTGSGTQPTGTGIVPYQNLSGSTFSSRVNSAGSANYVSLSPGIFTFSDFADGQAGAASGASSYGAAIYAHGLLGSGIDQTIIQMNPYTSTKKSAVPPDCGGGTSCPTNNLYLISLKTAGAKFDGITLRGTLQGHLYNGLRYETISNPVLSNAKITSIPGDSGANPGETFAVNFQRASGTASISNTTVDGAGVGAAGIAMNSCSAVFNINGLTTTNLKYSAGIALWQQTGTVNIHNWTNTNSARALGAERLGATVNLYDPNWGTSTTGHDITYTPYSGYSSRINVYYSSSSKVNRKIIILTNTTAVKPTVHVYINNVEQAQGNYVTWQGA